MNLLSGSIPTATFALQASTTGNPNNSIAFGERNLYLSSGTALTFQVDQTAADASCSTHAQFISTVSVEGPY